MDGWRGAYRRPGARAQDVVFWARWMSKKEEYGEQAKKWMGKQKVKFEEVSWGV